ncbi:hypothetical protein EVAR_6764_1 [Eumeta japonica]|uniref:Uncharacterized protein n=1 Tax=Eumeta variegata TaxID=151549 RepID=A0A4C1V4X3_EUMVA|nr:hypothetical protein EVAR_6764_1 [Eumeta japonica]
MNWSGSSRTINTPAGRQTERLCVTYISQRVGPKRGFIGVECACGVKLIRTLGRCSAGRAPTCVRAVRGSFYGKVSDAGRWITFVGKPFARILHTRTSDPDRAVPYATAPALDSFGPPTTRPAHAAQWCSYTNPCVEFTPKAYVTHLPVHAKPVRIGDRYRAFADAIVTSNTGGLIKSQRLFLF